MLRLISASGGAGGALVSLFLLAACGFFSACSFDYGGGQGGDESRPDIIMQDVEYVRVRGGDIQVRFRAESAERFEASNTMNLRNFSFEEFADEDEVNIAGNAGAASVEMDSGNISLTGGVKVSVESEDYTIETPDLQWLDKERQLSGSANSEVLITRSDGTNFIGRGFSADARYRTWVFESGIEGSYVEPEEEENEELEVRNEE